MTWKINFFHTPRGDSPVQEFIEQQPKNIMAKITVAIDMLESYGPFLKPPFINKIQTNLLELRVSKKQPVRIFYTIKNNQFHLLHVFKKKSQKIPSKEIKIALDRMRQII